MKRFQNISTVTVSVMKKAANGEYRSNTVKPAKILHLTEEDIAITKDQYNPRENNPFDTGFVAEIPAGKDVHPDLPNLGKNPSQKAAQESIKDGVSSVKKVLKGIVDHRGLVIMRRALDRERKSMTDSQFSQVDRMIDDQASEVEKVQKSNARKFGLKV